MSHQNSSADKARRVLVGDPDEAVSNPRRIAAGRRPGRWRRGLVVAAVSGIGVGSIVALGVASSVSGVAFAGQPTSDASIVDTQRLTGTARDAARPPLSVDDLAAQREAVMETTSESVAAGQQQAVLEVRQSNLQDAKKAVEVEADRLRNLANFLWPTAGDVGSPFGMRLHPILHYYRLHDGDDIGGRCGQPIFAAQSGTVVKAAMGGYNGGSGNNVRIDHGDINGHNIQTGYLHMSKIVVNVGQVVDKGELIGYVGDTGLSTACHLHLSLYKDGRGSNPMEYVHKPERTDAAAVEAAAAGKALPGKKAADETEQATGTDDPTVVSNVVID